MRRLLIVGLIAWLLNFADFCNAQEFIPRRQSSPPGPPLSPAQALEKMTVPEGFQVELVASEPDLLNPVAMAFDDRGRIYVTESFEYPRHEPGPGRDRIKILEDTDGDGKIDSVKIFAEGLNIPSGIAVGHGGVWVANAPDILFLEDTDGDDKADRSTVVVTGFGRDDTHELPNALTWGPDGCLYGLNGVFNRAVVKQEERVYDFTCAMFRIDPRTKRFDLFCQGTSNPWGIAFDHEGSAFISACVIDHLWHLTESAYYLRQGGPYPPHTWWAQSIVKHQHQMAAYCGIEYFDSNAYPKSYRDKLYMGNIHGGCINSDRVERSGATYQGFIEPDFLTANDVWFMPVAQKVGPDGCLYILDWYDRYHCYQDASADPNGVDRGHGRLYRVVYGKRPTSPKRDILKLQSKELVSLLSDDNIYVRQRAQLELSRRRASSSEPDIGNQLASIALDEKALPKTRMHALWSITGAGVLGDEMLLKLLASPSAEMRAWGVRIVGNQQAQNEAVVTKTRSLAQDKDPRVRVQVAIASPKLAVGEKGQLEHIRTLTSVLKHSEADAVLPNVVWQNWNQLIPQHQSAVNDAIDEAAKSNNVLLLEMTPRIASRLVAEIKPQIEDPRSRETLSSVLAMSKRLAIVRPDASAAVINALLSRVRTGEIRLVSLKPLLAEWNKSASQNLSDENLSPLNVANWTLSAIHGNEKAVSKLQAILADSKFDPNKRKELLQLLVQLDEGIAVPTLRTVLDELVAGRPVDNSFRDVAFDLGVSKLREKDLDGVFRAMMQLSSTLQASIAERICQRDEPGLAVLQLVKKGDLRKELFSPNRVRLMASSKSESMRELVKQIWGTVSLETSQEREAVIKKVADKLRWDARGDATRGWIAYDRICGQCHVMHNHGNEVGPNITANGRGSFEQLLVSVFHPSLVIGEAYKSVTIRTDDGTVVTGLLVDRNEQRTVIKLQGGKEQTILASDIEEYKQDSKSLMPEGVENQLSDQELADLFALLSLEKAPGSKDNVQISGTPERLHDLSRP